MRESDPQTLHTVMAEGMAECRRELKPLQREVTGERLARIPGFFGEVMRNSFAMSSADQAGDEPTAFRLAQAIGAQADAIKAEAQNDPGHAQELLNSLALAESRIGVGYESRGNDAEAAVYYQKAIDTKASINGDDTVPRTRLGFLYATGRGVPRDRDRALALFGGAKGEILGARGPTETAMLIC